LVISKGGVLMSVCYIHQDAEAIGTCVGCGKFICKDYTTEIKGKNYCKTCLDELFDEKNKKIEKLEDNKSAQPMVFMNAGGGGGGSSSSSSSSASNGGGAFAGRYTKSKVAAGLLGIFLGSLGIHKFYLGRWGWGVIYLLFCWTYIPGIVGFIEGIVYLLSSDESFARKHDKGYRSF
jgi:TM2 domain-containing membrane protein YozV